MGNPQILPYLLLISLLLLSDHTIADEDPSTGYHGAERDALLALKAEFNDPFLNHNWNGLQCYMNNPDTWYGIRCVDGRVTKILLDNMGLHGNFKSNSFFNLTELSSLSFRNNSISGNLFDFSNNRKLKIVDFSGNKLTGSIPGSVLSLSSLESLQLQDNELTGQIPSLNQSSLTQFNVSINKLSGQIPKTQTLNAFTYSSYFGNPELCGPPSPNACTPIQNSTAGSNKTKSNDKDFKYRFAVIILIFESLALFVVVFFFVLYCNKKKKKKETRRNEHKEQEDDDIQQKKDVGIVVAREEPGKLIFMEEEAETFQLQDLLQASAEEIGKGNFGNCYKAKLEDGPEVVVKRLRDLKPLSAGEFAKQMQVIADQKHPNLLPLIAYYYAKDEKLFVFKFARKGNLFNRIHGGRGRGGRLLFRWSSRLLAARGVARALEYLHHRSTSTPVPHGNLKSTNVLIDDDEPVLVCDYGLTSIVSAPIAAQRMVSYRSPEFQQFKKISRKSDVWSYGTLLLELLTGRVSAHSAPEGINGVDLCSWVYRAVREEWTAEIFDRELLGQRNSLQGMLRLLQVAMHCCDKSLENRPEMTEVVRELENIHIDDSEDEQDFSFDRSFADDSFTTNASIKAVSL